MPRLGQRELGAIAAALLAVAVVWNWRRAPNWWARDDWWEVHAGVGIWVRGTFVSWDDPGWYRDFYEERDIGWSEFWVHNEHEVWAGWWYDDVCVGPHSRGVLWSRRGLGQWALSKSEYKWPPK